MLTPIQPLQEAELPERKKPIYKMIGPGVVMAGLAIGSGELILWPWITSVVGCATPLGGSDRHFPATVGQHRDWAMVHRHRRESIHGYGAGHQADSVYVRLPDHRGYIPARMGSRDRHSAARSHFRTWARQPALALDRHRVCPGRGNPFRPKGDLHGRRTLHYGIDHRHRRRGSSTSCGRSDRSRSLSRCGRD